MIIDPDEAPNIASLMMQMRVPELARLTRIANYVRGKQDPPFAPKGANSEYRWIVKKSIRNFLPLIVSVISQSLHVDGYKRSGQTVVEASLSEVVESGWNAFRANRMVSRQHGVHRAMIKYGTAYVLVLPGILATDEEQSQDVPVIRPVSPRRMSALYANDVDDEWPVLAIEVRIVRVSPRQQRAVVALYDEQSRFLMTGDVTASAHGMPDSLEIANPADIIIGGQDVVARHNMGVCPVVRFLHEGDLDGEMDCTGEVEPISLIQDQINFTTFNEMMAEQYAAHRQRWITGMAPVDENNAPVAPFRPGVDRVWAAEDAATKFGEFDVTPLQPYLDSRESGIRHMSTISQVPPYHLLGQIANLSAEALAAARDGLDRKIEELQAMNTDPWRNVFRLSSLAAGDKPGWQDTNAQVVWRDTSARAFTATVAGLTQVAQQLGVPAQELWRRIPGATADDVDSWLLAAQRAASNAVIQQALAAASQQGYAAAGAIAATQAEVAAGGNPAAGAPATPPVAPGTPAAPAAQVAAATLEGGA